jgi:hypothetical protein
MPPDVRSRRLPFVVGITGHRDVRPQDEAILAQAIDAIFARLQRTYPSTPLLLLTPLAEGADWIAAGVAQRRGVPYRVPLPMPLAAYREDFAAPECLARFDELLRGADGPPYEMPFFETNDAANISDPGRRAHQYALLAAHLVRAAHVLIALWDGVPSTLAGGTAQAVRFRVLGVPKRYLHAESIVDAPETGPVHHIYTPALRAAANEDSAARSLGRAAECAATYYQKKFVTALQSLFAATALAIFVFELYAHLFVHAHPLVVVYLAASAFAIWTYARARRGRWQDRAQDYRALEIGLNVQGAWDAAGLGLSVADYYLRHQRTELDWIRDAIRTAHNLDRHLACDEAQAVATVRAFVLRQHAYFAGTQTVPGAAQREQRKTQVYARLSSAALRASFFISALLVAYGLCAWLAPGLPGALADEETLHGGLIFLIALFAIAAAMFADYPARRAHPQQARRYAAMSAMYRRALNALDTAERGAASCGDDGPLPSALETSRACILALGHEALGENGDWLLLHRELPIELLPLG